MDKANGTSEEVVANTVNQQEESQEEVHSDLEAVQEEMETQRTGDEIAMWKKKLEEKEEENKDYYDRMLRLQAEFTNYKKRVEKEKSDIYLYANEKLALELLSSIDNLERALDSQGEGDKGNALYEGIELVLRQMKDTLKNHGIEEIDALHKPFDMNLHHAVMKEEAEAEPDEVIEVFQKGYTIHGKVLRPAMVKVAQ
ncbi:nucleotide exchange factor GrpE [Clostridium formicaceticum]|uniref:Protein GrpE n=1 Tax=Clostridium formicaceticum TaxID=1497 RepID=A0AAC9RM47_9CLOT|nr:nucleotide exchange factor GrpE [Clostridium formicaceticum]AOY77569.1 nucleotide exchange factor GrpE [Clostridium formicaceticum]ARE88147.1 heat shock protein GrpE [Clostridium formicaceticum]